MSRDYLNENFYTFEELKDFTNNFTNRSVINISAFIEAKTNRKYSVIERKMLYDLNKQLFDNNIAVFNISKFLNEVWENSKDNELLTSLAKKIERFLNETWAKVIEKNHLVIHRWKEQLKKFE